MRPSPFFHYLTNVMNGHVGCAPHGNPVEPMAHSLGHSSLHNRLELRRPVQGILPQLHLAILTSR